MLDRALQLDILTKLSQQYPYLCDFNELYPTSCPDYDRALANLYYLQEHRLISNESVMSIEFTDGTYELYLARGRITHDGMDFLADDGGLRAILSAVTVEIDAAQMARLLQSFAELNQSDKQSVLDVLKNTPQKTVEHLIGKVVDLGWEGLLGAALITQSI